MPPNKTEQDANATPGHVASTDGLGVAPKRASIWERRGLLQKERREFMKKAMADFDVSYYRRMRELHDECGRAGHNWRFTHTGPLGNPWFACTHCGLSEARDA